MSDKFPLMTPDITVNARETFGVDFDMDVPAFSKKSEYVPEIDEAYIFDKDTTQAICAGFAYDRRVMVQGYHGTGKSTHIEQVALDFTGSEQGYNPAQSLPSLCDNQHGWSGGHDRTLPRHATNQPRSVNGACRRHDSQ